MRRFILIALVLATLFLGTAAAASSLTMSAGPVPLFGSNDASQCDLTGVEIIADYYVVAPKEGYYSGFGIRGTGTGNGCTGFVAYVRVDHGGHYYYLKIDADEVPVDGDTWAVLGVFEADPGEPLVYSTSAYDPAHIVAHNPKMEHSLFDETKVLVSTSFPETF